jgi:organic hydroperoxide reductase OsmC/OhrA
MKITARVQNSHNNHQVILRTNDRSHSLTIPPKPTGFGSSANGGEILFLALATCYCNDIYREASKRGITVGSVEVEVEGEFAGEGVPASNVVYRAKVAAQAPVDAIQELMSYTDQVAEVQNTMRGEIPVTLSHAEALPL